MSETSKHMKSEHDIDDYKPYVCKHCKSAWGDVANYCRHVRSHYQQNVICNVCGAELKPGSLQHHINRFDQNLVKMDSLYWIHSKMLHSTKAIIFII